MEPFKPLNIKRNDIYLAAMPKCTHSDTGVRTLLPAPIVMPAVATAKKSAGMYEAAIEALTD